MYDAILIGSGHNNLFAGVLLAEAGWKVAVFEQAEDVGGAVRTWESTLPGFRHDAFSNTHILIFISPYFRRLRPELEEHGLRYLSYPVPIASVYEDGDAVWMCQDREGTCESLGRQSGADAEGWRRLMDLYEDTRESFVRLLSSPVPSLSSVVSLAGPRLRLGARGNMEFAQMLILPARLFADFFFQTRKAKAWFLPWALHLPHSPESAGGGVFDWLVMATAQHSQGGLAVPAGGSGGLTAALASLLRSRGGEIRTAARVARIIIKGRTARGVVLADGTEVRAERAIIAGTAPTKLFLDLVGPEHFPDEFVQRLERYRYDLPVVKVDYALSRPVEWRAPAEVGQAGLVHISPSVDDMSLAYNQALRGYLPEAPLLIISQPTVVDPSRAPRGRHTLWVVARVPYEVKGDAAGRIPTGPWKEMKERFADRLTDMIENHAPGFRDSVLARHVVSPEDLETLNPNLVRGDVGAGSVQLHQSYVFRPLPGWSRYTTPIRRLYLDGAATHPGPGIAGMSGGIVAGLLVR